MKNILIFFLFFYLLPATTFADLKQIKKKAIVNNPEIIFSSSNRIIEMSNRNDI